LLYVCKDSHIIVYGGLYGIHGDLTVLACELVCVLAALAQTFADGPSPNPCFVFKIVNEIVSALHLA
jgi:hypothetical protein